jgi:ArsR family transcriptional regulator
MAASKRDVSEMFRVLGVDTRLRMIQILREHGPIGVTEIADMLGVTPAAVSQHLKLMRHAGLVTSERDGYRVPYSLDEHGLDTCRLMLIDACACGCHGHRHAPTDLDSLQKHKEMLEKELKQVSREIEKLKAMGK